MIKNTLLLLVILVATGCASLASNQASLPELQVPFTKVVLDNGLTVVVHEDHKAPLVAVNVWYHVGSKNEQPGKTGFAHLFEHLMFNGSEHYNDEYFGPFEAVGATGMNGTTSIDRTNYFQTVPSTALDMALWMESDRMGHFVNTITEERLAEQVEVVLNEKRQGENQPYGKVWGLLNKYSYPAGHPYSWPTIGYVEDIANYTVEDVRAWFEEYYGAANATLVIAGDIDTNEAIKKAKHYFGAIDSGKPITRLQQWDAELNSALRVEHFDNVPNERIYRVWNVPSLKDSASDDLNLFASYISSGKTAPLYEALVYEQQLADDVSAFVWDKVLGSQFGVVVTAKAGVDLDALEAALDKVMTEVLQATPKASRLDGIRTSTYSALVSQFQRVGGFGGKSHLLAQSEVYSNDPAAWKRSMEHLKSASGSQIKKTAQRWLHDKHVTLRVKKSPQYKTAKQDADRSKLPTAAAAPAVKLPKWQHGQLANGIKVILAERHDAPSVNLAMMFDGGFSADHGDIAGLAQFTMGMMDEGAGDKDASEIATEATRLGAAISTSANLDQCIASLSALKSNFDEALELFADVVKTPTFPENEIEHLRQLSLSALNAENKRPSSMAMRVLPPLLFGKKHAYGQPMTGTGTKEGIEAITKADLQRFHQTWINPKKATIVVVGDTDLNTVVSKLNQQFGNWQPSIPAIPEKALFEVPVAEQPAIYLIDKPNAPQSMIIAGQIAPSKGDPRNIALNAANRVLGGLFTSRLNLNLREDKHWSYGAGSTIVKTNNQRMFLAYASVQSDRTGDSISEIKKEITAIRSHKPVTDKELKLAIDNLTFSLPGRNETQGEVLGTIASLLRMGYGENRLAEFSEQTRNLSIENVTNALRVLQPEKLTWVVVGDAKSVQPQLRKLGFADVQLLPADE